MIEVVLLSLVIYTASDGQVQSRWDEVRSGFTTITECQNYANSVNQAQPVERLACIQRRK